MKIGPKQIALGAGLLTGAGLLVFIMRDFERSADAYGRRVAEQAALDHLAIRYGLTPSRAAGIERLASALGV